VDKGLKALYYISRTTNINKGPRSTHESYYLRSRGKIDNKRYNKAELYYKGVYNGETSIEKARKSPDRRKVLQTLSDKCHNYSEQSLRS